MLKTQNFKQNFENIKRQIDDLNERKKEFKMRE